MFKLKYKGNCPQIIPDTPSYLEHCQIQIHFLYTCLKNGRIMLYPLTSVSPSFSFPDNSSYSLCPIELKLGYSKTTRWASTYCLDVAVQRFLAELQPLNKIFQHVRFWITPPTVLIQWSWNFADSKTMKWSSPYYLALTLRRFLAELQASVKK